MSLVRVAGTAPAWIHESNRTSQRLPGRDALKAAILEDGPLALWLLDDAGGMPADSSGNARPVTSGSAGLGAAALVPLAKGSCDFASNGWDVADAAWMDHAQYTVEVVARADTLGSYRALVIRDSGGRAFQFRTYNNNLQVVAFGDGWGPSTLTGATTLATGTTYHLAWTHSDDGKSRLYVNGSLDATSDYWGATLASVDAPVEIGKGQTVYWDGRMSHVALHGAALSGARIAAHAAAAGVT